MADDVLLNKAATIERCVARAREEYAANPDEFALNVTSQTLQLPITVNIITHHLDEFTAFTRQILLKDIPNDQP